MKKYLPWIIGGVAVLLAAFLIWHSMRKKKTLACCCPSGNGSSSSADSASSSSSSAGSGSGPRTATGNGNEGNMGNPDTPPTFIPRDDYHGADDVYSGNPII